MIAGPPRRFTSDRSFVYLVKEGDMSDAKPAFKVQSANRSTECSQKCNLSFGAFASPVSPKIYELRSKYVASHITESNLKSSKSN